MEHPEPTKEQWKGYQQYRYRTALATLTLYQWIEKYCRTN